MRILSSAWETWNFAASTTASPPACALPGKLRPGDVYDATYLKQYLPEARKLLPPTLDWEVDPHVTAIARDKTVDVDLQYTAKAIQ